MNLGNLFGRLEGRDLIIPLLEDAITSGEWPDSYTVEIDSRPYYGLTDLQGRTGRGGSGDGYFHPSSTPFMGERRLFLSFHPEYHDKGIQEPRSVMGEMTLSMGSALHGVVQAQLTMAGILSPEKTEYEYIIEEHNCRGRIDGLLDLPSGETLWEMKTMNSFSFSKLETIKPEWDIQVSMGMYATGHDFGIVHVVESGWPYNMREFRVPRNDKLLSETFDKFDRVLDALESDTMPSPCCMPDSGMMKECPFRFTCWGDRE